MGVAHGILLAFLAATVYGFLGIAFELAAKRNYPNWDFTFYKQFVGSLIGLAFTLGMQLPLYVPQILLMALAGAICYLATVWSYLTASRERDIAANWTILNLSVVLPVLISIFWFNDRFTLLKGVAVGFTLSSVFLIGGFGEKKHQFTVQWARWITVAFLLNGWFVVLLRFVPEGFGALFTFYFYGLSALLTLMYKLVVRESWSRSKGIYWVAALGAATHWSGIMLTILALEVVAKVSAQAGLIVYPITNGLPIALGVVIGSLILKQRVSSRSAWGVACGSVAMILLSWS